MPRITPEQAGSANRCAFLDMIARSEGTVSDSATRDDGYDVLVTGVDGPHRFDSYATHPDVLVKVNDRGLESTAAGRYQLLYRYWVSYQKQLNLPDFGPVSQDKIALQQIRECNALDDIDAGNFAHAVALCSRIWASLPGNDYGEHQNAIALLQGYYTDAGGVLSRNAPNPITKPIPLAETERPMNQTSPVATGTAAAAAAALVPIISLLADHFHIAIPENAQLSIAVGMLTAAHALSNAISAFLNKRGAQPPLKEAGVPQ